VKGIGELDGEEEADAIAALVRDLLETGPIEVDENRVEKPIGLEDVLIVTPYNAPHQTDQGASSGGECRNRGQIPG
jgi:hypothetical protein